MGNLVINKNKAWHIKKKLNINVMKKAAIFLKGKKDFSTFRASSCNAKSPIRTIEKIQIKKNIDKIEILFVSRSFLQKQVRSMVGCLKYVGENRWSVKKFKEVVL